MFGIWKCREQSACLHKPLKSLITKKKEGEREKVSGFRSFSLAQPLLCKEGFKEDGNRRRTKSVSRLLLNVQC